jgi:hypothetical protein
VIPLGRVDVVDRVFAAITLRMDACVVDEDVDPTKALFHRPHKIDVLLLNGHIDNVGVHRSVGAGGNLMRSAFDTRVSVDENAYKACLCEPKRGGFADSDSRSRDDRNPRLAWTDC